jgi:hypothetical protein
VAENWYEAGRRVELDPDGSNEDDLRELQQCGVETVGAAGGGRHVGVRHGHRAIVVTGDDSAMSPPERCRARALTASRDVAVVVVSEIATGDWRRRL